MTEMDIRALALFFYFALLDDRKAIECSIEALGICNEKKRRDPNLKNSVAVIAATNAVFNKVSLKVQRGLPNTSMESGWILSPDVELGPWKEFQKNAGTEELLAVIWSRILSYSETDIADGLEVTSGTVRYRLARAFRKLGTMTHQFTPPPRKGPAHGNRP